MPRLVLITPATERLLTLAQAKAHCRVQNDLEDELFTGWIKSAEDYCQSYTSRAMLTSTYRWIGSEFPTDDAGEDAAIDLGISPVQGIVSVGYVDESGDSQTLDAEDYQLDPQEIAPKLIPGVESSWPVTQSGNVSAVTVDFLAGYTSKALVPGQFSQAMLLIVGGWYKNREDQTIPEAANRLLDQVISERYV